MTTRCDWAGSDPLYLAYHDRVRVNVTVGLGLTIPAGGVIGHRGKVCVCLQIHAVDRPNPFLDDQAVDLLRNHCCTRRILQPYIKAR